MKKPEAAYRDVSNLSQASDEVWLAVAREAAAMFRANASVRRVSITLRISPQTARGWRDAVIAAKEGGYEWPVEARVLGPKGSRRKSVGSGRPRGPEKVYDLTAESVDDRYERALREELARERLEKRYGARWLQALKAEAREQMILREIWIADMAGAALNQLEILPFQEQAVVDRLAAERANGAAATPLSSAPPSSQEAVEELAVEGD